MTRPLRFAAAVLGGLGLTLIIAGFILGSSLLHGSGTASAPEVSGLIPSGTCGTAWGPPTWDKQNSLECGGIVSMRQALAAVTTALGVGLCLSVVVGLIAVAWPARSNTPDPKWSARPKPPDPKWSARS